METHSEMPSQTKPLRVLIVEDQVAIGEMLAVLVERLPGFEVVGRAATVGEATTLVRDSWPDIVILDWMFPGGGGAEFLARMRRDAQHTRVLVFSATTSPHAVNDALTNGAKGFVEKGASVAVLTEAIQAVAADRVYFGPAVARTVNGLVQTRAGSAGGLTPREREVLKAVAEGLPSKAIATRLNMSVKTVSNHRAQISEKTGLHSIAQLTMHAVRLGLIPSPSDGVEAAPSDGVESSPANVT
jgi:DNA-binding NarL/FixJ family response regulator